MAATPTAPMAAFMSHNNNRLANGSRGLPSWSRAPLTHRHQQQQVRRGIVTRLDPLRQAAATHNEEPSQSSQDKKGLKKGVSQSTLEFLQKQHEEILKSLTAQVDSLKVENRELKLKMVMRDTATPVNKTRRSSQEILEQESGDISKMKTELVQLRARNMFLEEQLKSNGTAVSGTCDCKLELERMKVLNYTMWTELSKLRKEQESSPVLDNTDFESTVRSVNSFNKSELGNQEQRGSVSIKSKRNTAKSLNSSDGIIRRNSNSNMKAKSTTLPYITKGTSNVKSSVGSL
eukprot:m.341044 g.341044  ORF g.341044 m.341044 type:complete len:290 (-) comp19772_c0_seq1:77-946(-)